MLRQRLQCVLQQIFNDIKRDLVIGQGDTILQAMSAASSEPRHLVKKKEKQQLKHEAFIDSGPCFFLMVSHLNPLLRAHIQNISVLESAETPI